MRPIDADFAKERIKKSDLTSREKIALLLILEDVPILAPPCNDPLTHHALDMVRGERERQCTLWGDQSGNSLFEWVSILGEEYGELCEAVNETSFSNAAHPDRGGFEAIIKEAVQVAAVAVAIIEAVHRRRPEEGTPSWNC